MMIIGPSLLRFIQGTQRDRRWVVENDPQRSNAPPCIRMNVVHCVFNSKFAHSGRFIIESERIWKKGHQLIMLWLKNDFLKYILDCDSGIWRMCNIFGEEQMWACQLWKCLNSRGRSDWIESVYFIAIIMVLLHRFYVYGRGRLKSNCRGVPDFDLA